jgi:flagellar FliL protein
VAEENKPEENEQPGSKSNKKLIITIALVALLAIGLSVGVTLFLLMGDDKSEGTSEELDGAAPVEEVKMPASYLEINPPFLVTFNVDGRQRYMQISFSVSSRDASVFSSIEYHMPLIRSKLISTYGGMDFNLIKTDPGKVDLQKKTVEIINTVLSSEGEGQIENIYFTNFVLQ